MLRKKVIIKDNVLQIGHKAIPWDNIVGIKEYKYRNIQRVSDRFPRAEIFLKSGAALAISIQNSFFNQNEETDYESSIRTIRRNAKNLNPVFEDWIGWRLVLPIVLFELIVILIVFLGEKNIISAIDKMLFAGMLGAVVGWFWERKIRQKKASEM